jgi:hypothetical protein
MSRITEIDGVAVTLFDGFPIPLPDALLGLWEAEAEVRAHPA